METFPCDGPVQCRHRLDAGGEQTGHGSVTETTKRPRRALPAWAQKQATRAPPPRINSTEVTPAVAQTDLSRLTDPWATARSTRQEEVRSRSQPLRFQGRVVYSQTYAEVDAAARELQETINSRRAASPGDVPAGFDLEWKTSFQKGGVAGKVAVLQLCLDSTRCDVMQIARSGVPPSLASFLEDPSIVKVGVGVHGDASKLRSDYGIRTRGVVDLADIANQNLGRRWQSWSLASLAQELTCKTVEKVASIRCGDWEACPLSSAQLQYAATDAFASFYLYQILETFSTRTSKEERSSDSTLVEQATSEL